MIDNSNTTEEKTVPENLSEEKTVSPITLEEKLTSKEPKKKKRAARLKESLSFIFLVLVIVLPIRFFVAQPFIVNGDSMLPTFNTGEYLIIDQISHNFKDIQRGDVLVFRFPDDRDRFFIKRVIGLPGETVEISGEEVKIINSDNPGGFVLSEPHITRQTASSVNTTLSSGEYFMMGDNRKESLDSRVWGPLNEKLILGRAFLRLMPIDSLDYLPGKVDY